MGEQLIGAPMDSVTFATLMVETGKQAAATEIQKCREQTDDALAKMECETSDAAKEAYAKVTGKNAADITNADLKKAQEDQAKKEAREALVACKETATRDT